MAVGPIPLDEPIPYVLTAPEPKRKHRAHVRKNRRLKAPQPEEQSRIRLTVLQGDHRLPRTRGECQDNKRLCPLIRCRYHLYANIDEANGVFELVHEREQTKGYFDGTDPEDMPATCTLDIADRGGLSLDEVAEATGVSKETLRTDLNRAIRKLAVAFGINPADLAAAMGEE